MYTKYRSKDGDFGANYNTKSGIKRCEFYNDGYKRNKKVAPVFVDIMNAGYEIIQTVDAADKTFVLGESDKSPERFVTWRQFSRGSKTFYECGHYFQEKLAAQRDLLQRGLEAVDDEAQVVQASVPRITEKSENIHVDGHVLHA